MNYFNQTSERLIYRKLEKSDIESWTEFFVDNPNLPYFGIPDVSIEEKSRLWINMQLERYKGNSFGGLASICKETGKLIGTAGISKKEIEGKTEYEVAYSLKPKYWRQGYGTEMSSTMKQFAIENNIHNRVISIIHKDNIGSIKVSERNGMRHLFDTVYKEMPCLVYGIEIT